MSKPGEKMNTKIGPMPFKKKKKKRKKIAHNLFELES